MSRRYPKQYGAQLGSWFKDGRELSGGQWQKPALSRAFMRREAGILVLDEPTAAMDAQAEAAVFEHFRRLAADRMAILISHRFSTVRMADQIVVMRDGVITERGSHAQLLTEDGHYARLFALQAAGYRSGGLEKSIMPAKETLNYSAFPAVQRRTAKIGDSQSLIV